VGQHEAEVLKEEREGVDFAVEGFGHRDDCTSWGKRGRYRFGCSASLQGRKEERSPLCLSP
jgi:hypothetical protein